MTGMKLLVNLVLPPPLILTLLLALPLPSAVRKNILVVSAMLMNFPVLGGMKLVHLALLVSGIPFIDSGIKTYQSNEAMSDYRGVASDANHMLMKNQMLTKKWREERNFWIAFFAFTMWCMLTVLYWMCQSLLKLEEENISLKSKNNELRGIKETPKVTSLQMVAGAMSDTLKSVGLRPPASLVSAANGSAPPAPVEGVAGEEASEATLRQRAKKA